MTRGRPWTQKSKLNKCLLYLEGCPNVDMPMWTGFFGLPHWTRYSLVRKKKAWDAFATAQWLWPLPGIDDSQVGTLLFCWSDTGAGCPGRQLHDVESPFLETFKTQTWLSPDWPALAGLGDLQSSSQPQWLWYFRVISDSCLLKTYIPLRSEIMRSFILH